MWEEHSTAPLNCVYLGYPLGALLSILIVGLFRNTDHSKSEIIAEQSQFQSDLVGPYLIISICCLISSISFGLITCGEYRRRKQKKPVGESIEEKAHQIVKEKKRKMNKETFWTILSPTTCGKGYFFYGFILISLLVLFQFFFGKSVFISEKKQISFCYFRWNWTRIYQIFYAIHWKRSNSFW